MSPLKFLIKKYRGIEDNYMNRSPKGKWMFVRNIAQFILHFAGVPIIDPKFKATWYSYVSVVVFIDILFSFFYTVWYYYGHETIKGFLIISLFGILASSFIGYLMVIIPSNCKRLRTIIYFAYDYDIYTDITDDTCPAYIGVSNRSANNLTQSLFQTLAICAISGIIFATFPIYHFIMHHEIHLLIPVLLPFTNLESVEGIFINMMNQLFTASIGNCAIVGIEVIICMLKNSFGAISSAICYSIDVMTTAFNESTKFSNRIVEIHFRNIINQLIDCDRFLTELIDLGYWKFFIQTLTLNLSIALSFVFYLRGIWIPGLGVALFSYTQLFILCDVGSHINLANDMIIQKLSEMPWYLMSQKNQMTYAHLLNWIQNGTALHIGPFDVLNFVTFSKMTNKIYSFVTTLRKMLK